MDHPISDQSLRQRFHQLEAVAQEQAHALRHSSDVMLDLLSSIIEYRSAETGQHILRIRHFTKLLLEALCRRCPDYGLTDRDITLISAAAALHDIGKIAIPDAILSKPGPLTAGEHAIMETHALTGWQILQRAGDLGDPDYLNYARDICRCHHERWDGSGYPEGLRGDAIPVWAQVVGLADAYDALTSRRAYKEAYPFQEAVAMILRGECGTFSPRLLDCFREVAPRYEALSRAYADGLPPVTDLPPLADALPEEWSPFSSAALREKLRRYEIILSQTENVLFEWDIARDTIDFSGTWEQVFGFPPIKDQFHHRLFEQSHFHPDDLPLLADAIGRIENGSHYETVEVRIATARGRYIWCRIRASAIQDAAGRLEKVLGILINIDAEKQEAQRLHDRAQRDSLTRLLNKDTARRQAEEYLSRFPEGAPCALLIIDLDNFKQVNDQHGHLFGDAVLTRTAREIEKLFRLQDLVARIGGDEFLVLMRGVSDQRLVENRCRQLLQIFTVMFPGQKTDLALGCSIGAALSPEHGRCYFDLFHCADQALYQAKAQGKNTFFFYDGSALSFPDRQAPATAVNLRIDSDEEPGLANNSIVRYAFQQLYSARDPEAAMNSILALVGEKMNVSRVYIFENSADDRFCFNTYEWCNQGIEPQIHNLQAISYETDIPGYADYFDEQGIFYCPDVAVMPPRARQIVEAQGIKSMLQCAIRENGRFRGYIGFDECVEQRLWTRDQIDTLTYFSGMLSVFLMKRREHEAAIGQARQLRAILDNQNAWIYIIDPDTFTLRYLNAKTHRLAPEVAPGMCCHQALIGRDTPCPGCPARNIRTDRTAAGSVRNERFGLAVFAEATLIPWEGQEACLMTCRRHPETVTQTETPS